jgi:hypothetical protein
MSFFLFILAICTGATLFAVALESICYNIEEKAKSE